MCSKSSSENPSRPLRIGRVLGHRGNRGELTVVVASGRAGRWEGLAGIWIEPAGAQERSRYEVESSRSYRDRLVLKLQGVDGPGQAAAFRGSAVWVDGDAVPPLPEGEYYLDRLVGLTVHEKGEALGQVENVLEASGTHVLVVRRSGGGELLVPLVREIVEEVDESRSRILVRLPDGLLELDEGGES